MRFEPIEEPCISDNYFFCRFVVDVDDFNNDETMFKFLSKDLRFYRIVELDIPKELKGSPRLELVLELLMPKMTMGNVLKAKINYT
jgi:hypothetical protein